MKQSKSEWIKKYICGALIASMLLAVACTTESEETSKRRRRSTTKETTEATETKSSIVKPTDPIDPPANTIEVDLSELEGYENAELLAKIDEKLLGDSLVDILDTEFLLDDPTALGYEWPEEGLSFGDYESDQYAVAEAEAYLTLLETIDYEQLSEEDKIFYDVLVYNFEEVIAFQDYYYYISPVNSLTGIQMDLPICMAEISFANEEDIARYFAIIIGYEEYFADIGAFLEERAALGLSPTDDYLQAQADSCYAMLENKEDHFLVTSFAERLGEMDLTDKQKQDYIEQNQTYLDQYFFPAYEGLGDLLVSLKGTGVNEGGMCNFEGGKEFYEIYFQLRTDSDMGVEEGIAYLDAAIDNASNTINNTEFTVDFYDEYMNHNYTTGSFQSDLDFCIAAISNDFPELPAHNYVIRSVPEQLSDFFSPAAYLSCQLDSQANNLLLMNDAALESCADLVQTVAHESYPGHLFEAVYHSANITNYFQNYSSNIAYTEGWATYCENYIMSLTDYDMNVYSFVHAEDVLINYYFFARIDIGINYEGWTKDDVREYLASFNYGLDTDSAVDWFWDMCVEIPCYIMPYCFGNLQTESIMNTAFSELDGEATAKEIHTAYLDIGAAPFPIIEKYMNQYIESVQG